MRKSAADITGCILGVNHLGIAAKDPDKAQWFFRDILRLPFLGDELVKEQQTCTSMFASSHTTANFTTRLELLTNEPSQDGPIKKFLETRGGGIHHLALNVTRLDDLLMYLQEQGVTLIDQSPRCGAHRTRIAFVHPRSTGGVLVELVEEAT